MKHHLRIRSLLAIAAALAILIAGGCTFFQNVGHKIGGPVEGFVNGLSEAHDARQLGEADEDELGKAVAILVTNKYSPSDDKKLIQYVNLVGYTLVSASKRPDGHYVFGVLDTDDIGAYSGPNGYVMITRGALKSMRDEAELAGVLAHELTHVLDHHGLDAARTAATKAGYMDATKSVLGPNNVTKFIDSGVDAVVRNGYDKPQEQDADAGAVQLLIAAGYDPHSYANYLSHLSAMQEAQPRASTQQSQSAAMMKQIMATHPGIADRYAAVKEQIASAGTAANGGATMKARFAAYVLQ